MTLVEQGKQIFTVMVRTEANYETITSLQENWAIHGSAHLVANLVKCPHYLADLCTHQDTRNVMTLTI
jgi:hypothetical protein